MLKKSLLRIAVTALASGIGYAIYKYTDHLYWEEEAKTIPYERK